MIFKDSSQEFDCEVLDLFKKRTLPYEPICDFEKFNETLPSKNELHSSLSGKRISNKKYEYVLKVQNKFE